MARILILGVKVPFTVGGQDVLVRTLREQLVTRGHEVDTVELPLQVEPKEGILNQAALWRALDLLKFGGKPVDLVIPTKFPSYYVRHPRKSLWLVHQHRALYDLYGSRYSDISDDPRDEALRKKLIEGDAKVLAECSYRGAISQNVADRLKHFNSLDAEVLYPPLPKGDGYHCAAAEDFVLYVGRICSIKRIDLMLKAMPFVHNFVKLKIVGTADENAVMEYLKNEIDKHHLWDRIEFLGRRSDEEVVDLYSRALAVYYAPHNEDYGYVTLEAMASSKPVVTAHDSGGVLEFITHEENGLITEPTSEMIGKAVNRLVENKEFAAQLGKNGRVQIEKSGLLSSEQGWDNVIAGLLSPIASNGD